MDDEQYVARFGMYLEVRKDEVDDGEWLHEISAQMGVEHTLGTQPFDGSNKQRSCNEVTCNARTLNLYKNNIQMANTDEERSK